MKNILLAILVIATFSCGENPTPKLENGAQVEEINSLDSINSLIKKSPNSSDLYFDRAKVHYQQKDMVSSLSDVGRALKLDSSKADYYLLLADLKLIEKKSKDARDVLLKALEKDPENIDVLIKLGELHMLVEAYEESFEYLNRALTVNVYEAKAYQLKGFNYKFLNDTLNAVSSFQTAIEQDPDDYDSYLQLGLIYSETDHSIAADYLKNAIKVRPESAEAHYALGMFYQNTDEPRQALEVYDQILEFAPSYFQAFYNKGFIYLELLNEYDSASMMFSKAIQKGPTGYFAAVHNKGLSFERQNDLDSAEFYYRKALEINPQYDLSARGLSRVLGEE